MSALNCEVHYWTLRSKLLYSSIGQFSYHEKVDTAAKSHNVYDEAQKNYAEGRNITWTPTNRHPEKLKDTLNTLEDLLATRRCICVQWISKELLQMFLNDGIVVTCLVSPHTGDVDRISIDHSLATKVSADKISDVLTLENRILFTLSNQNKLICATFSKPLVIDEKFEKISSFEPKISYIEVPGPSSQTLDRKFSCSANSEQILCWWSFSKLDAKFWSNDASVEKDNTNMVLLSCSSSSIQLICYGRAQGDILTASFSSVKVNHIQTVEQVTRGNHLVTAFISVYGYINNRIQRITCQSIELKEPVLCTDRSKDEDKVILGCSDGTLVLYDAYNVTTQSIKASVHPFAIRWHPSDAIVLVISSKGEFQLLDAGLNTILINLVSESPKPQPTFNLATDFRQLSTVRNVEWSPGLNRQPVMLPECNDCIFITCDRGPLIMVMLHYGVMGQGHMSPLQLVNSYIKAKQINEAITLLSSLNWSTEAKMCYSCLCAIVNCLLKQSLTSTVERQVQDALATFYSPIKPLSESAMLEFRRPVCHLARRFFFNLIRYRRFEKALLLAVDIGARGLFMSLHYAAAAAGETAMSLVALKKAKAMTSLTQRNDLTSSYNEENSDSDHSALESIDYDSEDDQEDFIRLREIMKHQDHKPSLADNGQPSEAVTKCDVRDILLEQLESQIMRGISTEFKQCILSETNPAGNTSGTQGSRRHLSQSAGNSEDVIRFDLV